MRAWNKPNYEEAVMKCNMALIRDEQSFNHNGVDYTTEHAKYMLAVFGQQFGYESTIKNNYINLKKI